MVSKVKVLVVEDEFITMDLLRDYLEKYSYEVSGDAINADEAIAILEKGETDIALLDINLKGSNNGIWIAEQIRSKYHIPFIFISAYSDMDTIKKAANTLPSGYLVKPFRDINVFSAIEIALRSYAREHNESRESGFAGSDENLIKSGNFLFVKVNSSIKKIALTEIRFIQAFKNYLEFNCGDQKLLVRFTMQALYSLLPQQNFVQIHRSFIVNTTFITTISSNYVEIGNAQLPLSRANKDELSKRIGFQ